MGSDAHVIVVGGPASLAREAEHRIADLERRWSRFEEHSEVNALTRHAGSPVVVSPETRELVERAIAAWRMTRGLFDPTVLGALAARRLRPVVRAARPGSRRVARVT